MIHCPVSRTLTSTTCRKRIADLPEPLGEAKWLRPAHEAAPRAAAPRQGPAGERLASESSSEERPNGPARGG